MKREAIVARLKDIEPRLREVGVAGLFLYGSSARDETREDSDIDIYIDKSDAAAFGFDAFMDVYDILKAAIPDREISYTTREGLVEFYKAEIEKSAIRIF
jgi:uncharacterized protein